MLLKIEPQTLARIDPNMLLEIDPQTVLKTNFMLLNLKTYLQGLHD